MENSKLLIGTMGVTAVEVTNHVGLEDIQQGGSIIIQIIIAIATLIKLFKKNKEQV